MQKNQWSNCQHPLDHQKSERVLEKYLLLYWLCQSLWLWGSQQIVENSSRDGNTRPPDLPLEKSRQVKKQQLELDMEHQTGYKSRKEYVKAVYCHPVYLTYMQKYIMQNARLDEAQAGIKIAGRNINNLRYADDTTLMAENEEELKSLLMRVKEEWKSWFKTQHSKTKITAFGSIISW